MTQALESNQTSSASTEVVDKTSRPIEGADTLAQVSPVTCTVEQHDPSPLQTVAPIVTWLLVIIGWAVVASLQRARLRRQEMKGDIELCHQYLFDIQRASMDYWSKAGQDESCQRLEVEIKLNLQRLGVMVAAIDKRLQTKAQSTLRDKIRLVRQSCTGAPFESRDRQRTDQDVRRCEEIAGASAELLEELDRVFLVQYP